MNATPDLSFVPQKMSRRLVALRAGYRLKSGVWKCHERIDLPVLYAHGTCAYIALILENPDLLNGFTL